MPKKRKKQDDVKLLEQKCEHLEGIILEMVDLLPRGYTEIQRLQVRALRAIGWSDEEIKTHTRKG